MIRRTGKNYSFNGILSPELTDVRLLSLRQVFTKLQIFFTFQENFYERFINEENSSELNSCFDLSLIGNSNN